MIPVTALFPVRRSVLLLALLVLSQLLAFSNALCAQSADDVQKPLHASTALPYWQYGLFATGGYAPNYKVFYQSSPFNGQVDTPSANMKLDFWNAGLVGGRLLSALHGPGPLRGRAEAMFEIMPFWLAHYPKQALVYVDRLRSGTETQPGFGPFNMYGASVTPFLIRWNFQRHPDTRILPWAQVGGGLLWTNHKFPIVIGSTSVINFTPQLGAGLSSYVRQHQSVDLALKVVHISSAGLGDYNPGIPYTLQFSTGYSWWK